MFAKTAVVGKKLKWISAESKALVCRAEANNQSFIHVFILRILLEHLVYAKHYSRYLDYITESNQDQVLSPHEAHVVAGKCRK